MVMEIYFLEISKGELNFEVAIHDNSDRPISVTGDDPENRPPYSVFLTARDEGSRKIWSTPVMTDEGTIKCYASIDEAISDAKARILHS
ncbi:MAG TPA: hypothetical protein VEB86_01225 [Chryseosolibacter sp.]|nr:hypothetical protein [Chryseosolibacter sp.]